MMINTVSSFTNYVDALQAANEIAEADRALADRMAETRQSDLEHNAKLRTAAQQATLTKETLKPAVPQLFTTVSTSGKVRLPRSDQRLPPASYQTVLEREIAARRATASPV